VIRKKHHALAAAVAAAMALGVGSVAPSGAPVDAIKARQEAMEATGASMKVLGAIAKKQAPFDAATVQKQAGVIADQMKTAATAFPRGSEKGDVETWAKPEIWSDFAAFEKTLKAAQDSADAARTAPDLAALGPALGQLGGNCKACHDKYRRPKS
jgi:cytochrome c556